ncbi:MAG: phosphoglycerate kinase [Rickettsiales bacterium]
MKTFAHLDLQGKKVILRADLNVPVKDGKIIDASRIIRLKPTIEKLKEMGARIIIVSHFGRPDGQVLPEFSLKFMVDFLAKIFETKVDFFAGSYNEAAQGKVLHLRESEILLLENVRFHPEEEANDEGFAKQLASLGDVYINDAFACSHRAHASIAAITKFIPSYAGLLLLAEVENLEKVLSGNSSPRLAIVAGKKVSTKFPILKHLIKKVDKLYIAGAMANTFLFALGKDIGSSYYEAEVLPEVKTFYLTHKDKIMLPKDFIAATREGESFVKVRNTDTINSAEAILDIGAASSQELVKYLHSVRTLLWNGPLGMYEDPRFAKATNLVAHEVSNLTSQHKLISVAGGGDIVAALEQAGYANGFSYISTAGGAFLEWLEGKELPGIKALKHV